MWQHNIYLANKRNITKKGEREKKLCEQMERQIFVLKFEKFQLHLQTTLLFYNSINPFSIFSLISFTTSWLTFPNKIQFCCEYCTPGIYILPISTAYLWVTRQITFWLNSSRAPKTNKITIKFNHKRRIVQTYIHTYIIINNHTQNFITKYSQCLGERGRKRN